MCRQPDPVHVIEHPVEAVRVEPVYGDEVLQGQARQCGPNLPELRKLGQFIGQETVPFVHAGQIFIDGRSHYSVSIRDLMKYESE